jgi:hypothetical protein
VRDPSPLVRVPFKIDEPSIRSPFARFDRQFTHPAAVLEMPITAGLHRGRPEIRILGRLLFSETRLGA